MTSSSHPVWGRQSSKDLYLHTWFYYVSFKMLSTLQFHSFWWYQFLILAYVLSFGVIFSFFLSNVRLARLLWLILLIPMNVVMLMQQMLKGIKTETFRCKKKTRHQKSSWTSHFMFCFPGLRMIWGRQNSCRQAFALSFKSSVLLLRPRHLSQMYNLDIETSARDGLSTSTDAGSCSSDLFSVLLFYSGHLL